MSDEARHVEDEAEGTASRAERYFDGRMDPAETRAFEAELESSPALMAEVAELQASRELLRGFVDEAVAGADFSNFFSEIQARLPAPAPAVAPAAPTSSGGRLKAWIGRFWVPTLVGAAAAGAVAVVVARMGAPMAPGDDEPVLLGGAVQVDEVSNEGPKTVLISMPVEDDEESGTVIWLLDEETDDTAGGAPADGEDPI